jgi:hypothetical protein
MNVLGIDPGNEESAYVLWNGRCVLRFGKVSNEELRGELAASSGMIFDRCVIEQIASYGMAVGAEVFETCVWTGRFIEVATPAKCERITRLDVKMHLCHDSRAKDSNIRHAIVDRFGGNDRAIGKKKSPGPLFGISGDCWSALAVALTWMDGRTQQEVA